MQEFNVNSPLIYAVSAVVVVFVFSQSIFFLIKAWRQAKRMGMEKSMLRRIATSSAVFTIAPAIAILLGVLTLSNALGLPTPWMRLTILGSVTYELPAAEMAATATGNSLSERIADARVYTTILWVMTLGIIPSLFLAPFLMKRIHSGVMSVGAKDKKWGEIFMTALFLGMISAFLGMIFSRIGEGIIGWIPVFVMLCSAVLMGILGVIYKKGKIAWLENYALPLSMLGAMALSIPITNAIIG